MNKITFSILVVFIFLLVSSVVESRVLKLSKIDRAEITHKIYNPAEFICTRIMKYEGFRPAKYRDRVSGITLQGYGTRITRKMKTPKVVSKELAKQWVQDELKICAIALDKELPWWRTLSPIRQAAMLDLTFNMGIYKLKTFKNFLHNMKIHNYSNASLHLMRGSKKGHRSRYSKQVGIRAQEISMAIRTNKWYHLKELS